MCTAPAEPVPANDAPAVDVCGLDHGRIVALDTPDALKRAVGADTVTLVTGDDPAAQASLTAAGYAVRLTSEGLVAFVSDGESSVAGLVGSAGAPIRQVHVHRPTLDDVFLHFTGRGLRDHFGETRAMPKLMQARRHRRH